MVQIALEVRGDPDFYPDGLDLPALPPVGTVIDIDGREFSVRRLLIKTTVRPHDGGGVNVTSRYVAEVSDADPEEDSTR